MDLTTDTIASESSEAIAKGSTSSRDGKLAENSNQKFPSLLHEFYFLFLVVSAQFSTQVCVSQGLSPVQLVGSYFKIPADDNAQLSWAIASFSLTSGTFIVIGGKLGDLIGHKRVFLFGYTWLTLSSLITGFSYYSRSSPIFFYVCRGLQGFGAAFLLPNGLALLGRTYASGRRKTFVFAAFGACTPLGFVVGSTFAAIFGQLCSNWAWIYWSTSIIYFFLTTSGLFIIPNDDLSPGMHSFRTFDFSGSLTGVTGLILFNVAWNQVPTCGWNTPSVVLLILGVLNIFLFVIFEFNAVEPLIPVKEMSLRIIMILICVACGFGAFGIWIFFHWQFLLVVRSCTPLKAAAQFSPVAIAGICAAGATGILFQKKVPPSFLILLALIGFLIPSVLLATVPSKQAYWASTFVASIIAPFGVDVAFPAASLLLSDSVPRQYQGVSASLVATVVNYSISLGLGVAGVAIRYSVSTSSPESSIDSIRVASYVSCGLASFGIVTGLIHMTYEHLKKL